MKRLMLLLLLTMLTHLNVTGQNLKKDNALTFDRPKSEEPIPNPYIIGYPKDVIMEKVAGYFKDSEMQLDPTFTRKEEGILVTKPFIFVKGTLTRSRLDRFGNCPAVEKRNWTRGRVTFQIVVEAVNPNQSKISISGRLEGLSQELSGSNWIGCQSNGQIELQVLEQLIESLK